MARSAGEGSVAVLLRRWPHAFVVANPEARSPVLHVPGGFHGGVPASSFDAPPAEHVPPEPEELAWTARNYHIELLGPPLQP